MTTDLVQLVGFRTSLSPDAFVAGWTPVARSFLRMGLTTITLASLEVEDGGLAFVSRNTWPADAYRAAFPEGLATDGAAGPVRAAQLGVFAAVDGTPVAEAQPRRDLTLVLLGGADEEHPVSGAARDLGDRVLYRAAHDGQRWAAALTVHGDAGTGSSTATTLAALVDDGVVLRGCELLTLT